jgi:hypothetical protein
LFRENILSGNDETVARPDLKLKTRFIGKTL